MEPPTILFILFRFFLPLFLTIVSVLRFNSFSLCYLLICFFCPFIPIPKRGVSSSGAKVLLILLIILATLFILAHVSYNVALAALQIKEIDDNCTLGYTMNQIGLHQFDNMHVHRALRILVPDLAVNVAAACIFAYLQRVERHQYRSLLSSTSHTQDVVEEQLSIPGVNRAPDPEALQRQLIFTTLYNFATAFCCAVAGIMSPSLLASVYLLAFMVFATLWACVRLVDRELNTPRIMLLIYTSMHVLLFYLYQFEFMQSFLSDESFAARLLGLYWLCQNQCSEPGALIFNNQVRWTEYAAPVAVLVLYYVVALTTRRSLDLKTLVVHEQLVYNFDSRSYGTTSAERDMVPLQEQPRMLTYTEKPFFMSLITNIIRISYIVAFLAMMAWSVIYVSWLSFALLLTACLIWIVPKSRLVCLHISPFIVLYGSVLLLLQYVFAMNLDKELPDEYNGVKLETFGMKKFKQPVGVLAAQIGLMAAFWLTLRLYTTEKQLTGQRSTTQSPLHEHTSLSRASHIFHLDAVSLFGSEENSTYLHFMTILRQQFVKIWIVVTCLLMLIISTQQPVVMYRIVYMVLFIYFMFTFMVAYDFWRKQMLIFWWIIIAYSMIVLIGIYTFQFEEVRGFWQSFASNATLADIGLQTFNGSALFERLMTPVIFLIVVIFQVHYFHNEFIRISTLSMGLGLTHTSSTQQASSQFRGSGSSEEFMRDMSSFMNALKIKALQLWEQRPIVWRVLEVHIDKVIIIFATVSALMTMSALWLPLIFILFISLPFLRSPWKFNLSIFLWIGIMIICKMVSQLGSLFSILDKSNINCSLSNLTGQTKYPYDNVSFTIANLTNWIGLKSPEDYRNDMNYLLALVCFVIMHTVVYYHEIQYHQNTDAERPMDGIIFPRVTKDDIDTDVKNFIKFMFNHGFYKFGLELTFIVGMIAVAIRADGIAIIYLALTMILIFLPRHVIARLWGAYCVILGLLWILEYLAYLGLPVNLCHEYLWTQFFQRSGHTNWVMYLTLPDYVYKPPNSYLIADGFRFIFASFQMRVFRYECSEDVLDRGGGDNKPCLEDKLPGRGERDFLSVKESFLDYAKYGIFMYFFYISFFILFAAGLMSISLLGLLYLISSFIFMWMGMNLYMKPRRTLLCIWNCVIAYNVSVLILKCGLQIIGCIYADDIASASKISWVTKLFTVKCLKNYQSQQHAKDANSDANGQAEFILATTLVWDVICFSALLIQRKIFLSDIFSTIVLDIRVQKKFASRGAAIINSRLIYEVTVQKVAEWNHLARIRRKIERMRLRRQNWGVPSFEEHFQVLRSGDARLFEDVSDEDEESAALTMQEEEDNTLLDEDDEMRISAAEMMIDDEGNEGILRRRKTEIKPAIVKVPRSPEAEPRQKPPARQSMHPIVLLNRVIDQGPSNALEELNLASPTDTRSQRRLTHRKSIAKEVTDDTEVLSDSQSSEYEIRERQPTIQIKRPPILERRATVHERRPTERRGTLHEKRRATLQPTIDHEATDEVFHDDVDNLDSEEENPEHSEENSEESDNVTCWLNCKASFIILWKLFMSLVEYLTEQMDHITREYRNIRLTLEAERKLAKQKVKDEGEINTLEIEITDIHDENISEENRSPDDPSSTVVPIRPDSVDPKVWKNEVQQLIRQVESAETEFKRHRSRLFLLLMALMNMAGQYWEQLCYLVMIINHTYSASLLSMMYPFLIFIWGMLSVPRPSKLFWSTVIVYTIAVIIIKYLFQFPFETLDTIATFNHSKAFECINLGLKRNPDVTNFATWDLVQLMVVFMHRGFLKASGLWRAVSDTHEEMVALAKRYTDILGYKEARDEIDEREALEYTQTDESFNPESIAGEVGPRQAVVFSGRTFQESPKLSIKRFFEKMTDPLFNVREDVYAYMFFCEFVGFLILVFGYQYFVPYTGTEDNVARYISQSKIPIPFLLMCILQFVVIIIDRALFLQKLVVGKLIFQFIMMITIHIWLFLILPCLTNREFTDNRPAQIFYFLKCIYFGLSAKQIRSGYPHRVLGNFLTKGYNYVNLFLFKGFTLIPFLMDLRIVMDWVWTETTLGLYHWDQMEHIYSIIFVVKCWHYSEELMPTPRGNRRSKVVKYGLGGIIVSLIILAIWLPMLVFSILGATATPNRPINCEVSLSIGGFTPIYKATAQTNRILNITPEAFNNLRKIYANSDKGAVLSRFKAEDLSIIPMDENSALLWSITPPGQESLIKQLNKSISSEFSLTCRRRGTGVVQPTVSGLFRRNLNFTEREQLINAINNSAINATSVNAQLSHVFPRYVYLNKDKITYQRDLSPERLWVNLSLSRNQKGSQQWWRIREFEKANSSRAVGIDNTKTSYMITLNERAYQTNIITEFFAGYGIIGLYVVFVIWFSKLIRQILFCSDTLRFDDSPYVDRILALCHDIYMVREHKDWELEEELYSKLDYLWRSPETMIKFTRPKTKTE